MRASQAVPHLPSLTSQQQQLQHQGPGMRGRVVSSSGSTTQQLQRPRLPAPKQHSMRSLAVPMTSLTMDVNVGADVDRPWAGPPLHS